MEVRGVQRRLRGDRRVEPRHICGVHAARDELCNGVVRDPGGWRTFTLRGGPDGGPLQTGGIGGSHGES